MPTCLSCTFHQLGRRARLSCENFVKLQWDTKGYAAGVTTIVLLVQMKQVHPFQEHKMMWMVVWHGPDQNASSVFHLKPFNVHP